MNVESDQQEESARSKTIKMTFEELENDPELMNSLVNRLVTIRFLDYDYISSVTGVLLAIFSYRTTSREPRTNLTFAHPIDRDSSSIACPKKTTVEITYTP